MYFLYELELENGCYYIGITTCVKRRMKEHREESYRCAAFVKRNHLLRLIKVTKLYTGSKKLAKGYEDEKTLEYIHERGHERVRGGYYAQSGVWDQLTRDRLQKGADYLKDRPARRGCKQGSMIL